MAEKEYIEREAAKRWLHEDDFGTPDERWRPESEFAKMLDAIPAADVATVVHARWITEDNTEGYRGDPHCTACKYILPDEAVYGCTPGVDDYFYCPNCGARMDGGKHG